MGAPRHSGGVRGKKSGSRQLFRFRRHPMRVSVLISRYFMSLALLGTRLNWRHDL